VRESRIVVKGSRNRGLGFFDDLEGVEKLAISAFTGRHGLVSGSSLLKLDRI